MPAKLGACPQSARTGLSGVQLGSAPPVACPVTPASACLAEVPPSIRFCSVPVYPGTARWSPSVRLNARTSAVTTRMAPITLRTAAAWTRTERIRVASSRPARANSSRGTATPTANAAVSTTADQPIRCWAPTSAMAASTGPAQGTKTSPRLSPRTNPPPSVTSRPAVSRANGRSNRSPRAGTMRPRPRTPRTPIPIQRNNPSGSPRALSSHDPTSTVTEKLSTRPATTAKGRRRRRAATSRARASEPAPGAPAPPSPGATGGGRSKDGAGPPPTPTGAGTAASRGISDGPPARSTAGSSSSPLAAPDAKITGSTGRMHGEIPVTRPPRNPTTIRRITTQASHASRNGGSQPAGPSTGGRHRACAPVPRSPTGVTRRFPVTRPLVSRARPPGCGRPRGGGRTAPSGRRRPRGRHYPGWSAS